MKWGSRSRSDVITRRGFLGLASAAAGLWIPRWAGAADARGVARDPARPSALDHDHAPLLRVPAATANGSKVPIVVEMAHPMTPEHHVTVVRVTNESDPISSKGTFHFTPDNGRVYLAFQVRMHQGPSEVSATVECNRHGTWTVRRPIEIPAGAGGCAGTGPLPAVRAPADEIRPPIIRIAELVDRGRIRRGDIVHVQVKMKHPSRTGLVFRGGRFVQEAEPLHLDEMEVRYGDERVSRFAMTSALSDDPFITFTLLARREAPITVAVTNCRGERFEATHELRLG
jgi:sulfur-oxidizing protein SoxY